MCRGRVHAGRNLNASLCDEMRNELVRMSGEKGCSECSWTHLEVKITGKLEELDRG